MGPRRYMGGDWRLRLTLEKFEYIERYVLDLEKGVAVQLNALLGPEWIQIFSLAKSAIKIKDHAHKCKKCGDCSELDML